MKTLFHPYTTRVINWKPVLLLAFLLCSVSALQSLKAQDRWRVELRPAAAFTTKKLADADLKTGFGFEATLAYRFLPHLSAYAGWGWNRFSADMSFAGQNIDFEETGYTFGLQYIHPFGSSKIGYLLEAGGIYNHIELENQDGNIKADSGHGLGWQAGAGLAIPLGERFRLTPTVRYRSLSRDLKVGSVSRAADLNYISAGLGVAWIF